MKVETITAIATTKVFILLDDADSDSEKADLRHDFRCILHALAEYNNLDLDYLALLKWLRKKVNEENEVLFELYTNI